MKLEEEKIKKDIDENKEGVKKETSSAQKKQLSQKINKKTLILAGGGILIFLIIVLGIFNKEGSVQVKVKSSLDKLVEKSDLETVTFTYNVIAKECKDDDKCDKTSNDIDDFEYVISCDGSITAGIDFEKTEIEIKEKEKKVIINLSSASVTDINVGTLKFINGDDIPASELVNARNLCEETIKEKSNKDEELLLTAKEQAKEVLMSFYGQWLKSIDDEYTIEIN